MNKSQRLVVLLALMSLDLIFTLWMMSHFDGVVETNVYANYIWDKLGMMNGSLICIFIFSLIIATMNWIEYPIKEITPIETNSSVMFFIAGLLTYSITFAHHFSLFMSNFVR